MYSNLPASDPAPPSSASDSVVFEPSAHEQDVTVVQLVALMLRHRRRLAAVPIVALAVVTALALFTRRTYTTSISLTPTSASSPLSSLSGLAGQLGVQLPGTDPTDSPDFYVSLIQTPELLRALAQSKYTFVSDGKQQSGTLAEIYEIDKGSPGKTLAAAQRLLANDILTITFDRQTSIVSVDVQTRWPEFSKALSERLLVLLDEFNLSSRQGRAAAERRFMQERLDTAGAELRAAEDRMQAFLEHNRDFRNDPALTVQNDRLERQVSMRQQVVTTLMQALEQARIEAVRNTPSFSIVQHPTEALEPDRRHLLIKGVAMMGAGFAAVILWTLFGELARRSQSRSPGDYETLQRLLGDVGGDLRRLTFRRRRPTALQ